MSRITLFILISLSLTGCNEQFDAQRTYVLSTGTTGGTFYPVGVALSTLVSAAETIDFSLTAISSAGSMENIKLLRDDQAQFALILGIFGAWAYDGSGPIVNPQTNLRSISAMWPNVEQNFAVAGKNTSVGFEPKASALRLECILRVPRVGERQLTPRSWALVI